MYIDKVDVVLTFLRVKGFWVVGKYPIKTPKNHAVAKSTINR